MTSQNTVQSRARSPKKLNKYREKQQKRETGNGAALKAPAFLAEFVERGRELQHEGARQIENLRVHFEEVPLGKHLVAKVEEGSVRVQGERDKLVRWATRTGVELRGLREQLLHQLGLATTRDIQQISRRVNTLRQHLKEMAQA